MEISLETHQEILMRIRKPFTLTVLCLAVASCSPLMLSGQAVRNLPLSPLSPRTAAQCETLQSQWDALRQQVQAQHQQCLSSHSGELSNPNSGSGPGSACSHSGCQSLHTELFTILVPREQSAVQQCRNQVAQYQQQQRLRNSNQTANGVVPTPLQTELNQLQAQAKRLPPQAARNPLSGQVQALLRQAQSLAAVQARELKKTDPVTPTAVSSAAAIPSAGITAEQYEAAGLSSEAAKAAVNYDSAFAISAHARDDLGQLTNQILASDPSRPSIQVADPNAPVTSRDFTQDDLQAQRERQATELLAVPMVKSWAQLLKAPVLEEGVPAFLLEELQDVAEDKMIETLREGAADGCLNSNNEAYCATRMPTPQPGPTPSVGPAPQNPSVTLVP